MSLPLLVETVARMQERLDLPTAYRRLPDYENENFTPTLLFAGTNVGMTTSTASAKWWSFGPLVVVMGRIALTNKGTVTPGQATVGNMPFTASSTQFSGFGGFSITQNMAGAINGAIFTRMGSGTKLLQPQYHPSAGTGSVILTDVNFTATSLFDFWHVYEASTAINEVDWLEA